MRRFHHTAMPADWPRPGDGPNGSRITNSQRPMDMHTGGRKPYTHRTRKSDTRSRKSVETVRQFGRRFKAALGRRALAVRRGKAWLQGQGAVALAFRSLAC